MFDFLKKKAMKTMMASQLKNLPEDQKKKIEVIMEKDPEFLMALAKEVQHEMKNGKNQMQAFMHVAQKHQEKLRELMS